jgi:DnaA family protein
MKQLLLNLDTARPPTLTSFVVGQHAELVALLQLFEKRQPSSLGERSAYIWGESGVGKSHLLLALRHGASTRYLTTASPLSDFEPTPAVNLYLLDDCQTLNDQQQIAAFNLYNQIKENRHFLVASGSLPPGLLTVREDFRTRLGWGLIYQLHRLTDQEKIAALKQAAHTQGVAMPENALAYLVTHFARDMPSLLTMQNALIHYSLEIKHPITLPLLREVMQQMMPQQQSHYG